MKDAKHTKGIHTLSEIQSQADSWDGVLKRIDDNVNSLSMLCEDADEVLFTGCGSGFNIAHAVSPYFQRVTGKTCKAVHASDIMLNREEFFNAGKKTLLIAYSRSGDTTESVEALRQAADAGASTVAIVCFKESAMAGSAHVTLILEEAVEKSVTTTRSLTSMVLAGNYLAAACAKQQSMLSAFRDLPDMAREKMDDFHHLGKNIASDPAIRKYAFLGHGSYYGLAREAQLKIKEMVLLPSDSYVSLDYQHGPMSNVDQNMLVTIMASDSGRQYDREVARNMKALGGKILVLCDQDRGDFAPHADYLLELATDYGDGIRNILYMPVLQFMAYYKSLSEGQDPDNPKNLYYYVTLDS
jgi:glucosamine--fructose-6-phosphate aminotransferase (isomerizing)